MAYLRVLAAKVAEKRVARAKGKQLILIRPIHDPVCDAQLTKGEPKQIGQFFRADRGNEPSCSAWSAAPADVDLDLGSEAVDQTDSQNSAGEKTADDKELTTPTLMNVRAITIADRKPISLSAQRPL